MSSTQPRCPECAVPLSLWRVVCAPLPNRLRCAGCRSRLRFDANLLAIVAVAVFVFAAVVLSAQPVYRLLAVYGVFVAGGVAAVLALGLWLAFEVALAQFLLSRRPIRLVND